MRGAGSARCSGRAGRSAPLAPFERYWPVEELSGCAPVEWCGVIRGVTMTALSKYFLAVVAGTTMLAFSAVSASAAYACNGNVCWVVKEKYSYPADSKVIVREESWKPSADITIREPGAGRGYYVGSDWRSW